jgi:hypothetical protein
MRSIDGMDGDPAFVFYLGSVVAPPLHMYIHARTLPSLAALPHCSLQPLVPSSP